MKWYDIRVKLRATQLPFWETGKPREGRELTVHSNGTDNILTHVLLQSVSMTVKIA